ncbi:MAG: SRPBCC family protein [Anaerolineales bacterium]|nr:SRPBCC family protein [Anaerolineales bacterium]
MPTITTSVVLDQPADRVFSYIIDVANHPAWQAGIKEAKLTPAGPVSAGSTYTYITEVMGQRIQSQMQVSTFLVNQVWAVKTVGVPNAVETIYRFEPAGAGTRLTIAMEVPAGAYPAAVEGMVKQQMLKSLEEQAARISRLVG